MIKLCCYSQSASLTHRRAAFICYKLKDVLKTALFSIFGVTLKRAKMKALSRANTHETSSEVRKRHFLATDEISVRLKNVQMVFDSFATFFILLGGLVILTHRDGEMSKRFAL